MRFIIILIPMFIICCNNKQKNISEKNEYIEEKNITSGNCKDSSILILNKVKELSRAKTFREATPLLEKEIENNSINSKERAIILLQLSNNYFLHYLVDNNEEFFKKSEVIFEKILNDNALISYTASFFNTDVDVLNNFRTQWNKCSEENQKVKLMIYAYVNNFKE